MATRIKNSSFVGSSQFDVDIDAPTFNRVVENAIGDTAKVHDQLTGLNGEADVIVHNGDGLGALLGIPYINQHIGVKLFYVSGGSGKDGVGGLTWLYACPLFVPDGETEIVVDLLADADFDHLDVPATCYLRDATDYDVVAGTVGTFEPVDDPAVVMEASTVLYRAKMRELSPGAHLFFIEMDTSTIDADNVSFRIHSVTAHPSRKRRQISEPRRSESGTNAGVMAPTSTQAVTPVDFDESLIDTANDPINGYLTSYLNQKQNALFEYLFGVPAGGNASLTQEDQDGAGVADAVDPARSRFHAHARSPFAGAPALPDEPEVQFPLHAEGFGPFRQDGGFAVEVAVPPTFGLLTWYPPWPTDDAVSTVWRCPILVPDFSPDKATPAKNTSALKAAVLCGTDDASLAANWSVAAGVSGSMPAAVALTAVPNAPNGKLFYAVLAELDFHGDVVNDFIVTTQRAGGNPAKGDELVVLGVCFWFDPT